MEKKTGKKISRRQLEKVAANQFAHINNARDMVKRLSEQLKQKSDIIKALDARVQVAGAYIGYLVAKCENPFPMGPMITKLIPKEAITNFIDTKQVTWEDSPENSCVLITVKERVVEETRTADMFDNSSEDEEQDTN